MKSARSMIIHVLLFTLGLWTFSGVCLSQEMEVIFSDDFSGYKDDTEPVEKWSIFAGHWFVKEGTLHQDQGSFDYGLVVKDLYLRCDYRMEVKVRLVSGGSGAGWYWNMYDALTGESGNMLRYDGEFPIMYGWMRGRGFVGTGGATGDLRKDGKWHAMVMDVHNSTGTFDMYWDGKKIIDGAYSFHRSGYAGLQCSLGHCEFDDFKISVKKGTDWRASPKDVVKPEWIQSLAVMPDGNIVYPVRTMHRIQIVTPDGKLVREFGSFGERPGQLNLPSAVAVDKEAQIYVTESGNNRVQVFSAKGKSLKVIKLEGENALNHPFGIAVAPDGKIWIGNADNNHIVELKADGSFNAKVGAAGGKPGQFNKLMHLSYINGKVYAADSDNMRIQIFDGGDLSKKPEIISMPDRLKPASVDFDGKGRYVVSTWRGLATFDKNWNLLKKYYGNAEGDVWPYQSVFDKKGNIVIGDWWEHRILIVSPELVEVKPELSDIKTNSAVLTWETDLPTPTRVMLLDTPQGATWPSSVDYSKAKVFGSGKLETKHQVALKGLKPATRHTYAIGSPRKMIPATGHSIDFRFITKAPEGMMAYTEAPIALLCYSNVTFKSRPKPDGTIPDPAIRDEKWLEQVKKNHEAMRYFYWLNSYFRLDTRPYYLQITRPVEFAYLGSSSEEVYKDLAVLAKREGMIPEDFGGVLVVGGNGTYAYPWPTPWWGGKLTYTTGCCFCGGGDMWIGTHEFHHVTEGWMRMIRCPNYTCADTPWVHPGRIGENYDFLADTLRIVGDETHLNLAVGKIVLTADKDSDGVPDNAPITTFDEKRAGTSTKDKFSYKNGLTDLQNLTAESFTPAVKGHKHPMLTTEINNKFPFAVFDYDYGRKKRTPMVDGTINEGEWDKFASTPNAIIPQPEGSFLREAYPPQTDADYRMNSYLNWDNEYLYIGLSAPYKYIVSVQLDADADGYFAGRDNPRFDFDIPQDESKIKPEDPFPAPRVMVWNNAEPVKKTGMPNWTNDIFDKKEGIKWAWKKDGKGWYNMEVAIPKCSSVGLDLLDGEEISMRLWFSVILPPGEDGKARSYAFEMFENCEYAFFKLVK